jgi:ferredoxin
MADESRRLVHNINGPYYVDDTCIYCDFCVELYPHLFKMIGHWEWAAVYHQPETEQEFQDADDAIECCPTESIGKIQK